MSALEWKTPWAKPETSRWSDRARALFDPAEATEAEARIGFDPVVETARDLATVPAKYLSRMNVRAGNSIVLIRVCDIVWVQSHRNLLRLHLKDATYEHRMTMKEICTRLDPERFLRVHRTAIVNLDHVVEFELPRSGSAAVHLSSGQALPVSRAARLNLRRGLLSQSYA
jgi:two-component system LytT family response regulator